ncbi:MAG: septum formation initiator family protein, partial [Ruminococcus sp.]
MKREEENKKYITNEDIKEVKVNRKNRNKKKTRLLYIPLCIAVFAFVVFSAFTLITQSSEITKQRAVLDDLNKQIEITKIEIKELKDIKNYEGEELDDYIENIAREDLNYLKNGER